VPFRLLNRLKAVAELKSQRASERLARKSLTMPLLVASASIAPQLFKQAPAGEPPDAKTEHAVSEEVESTVNLFFLDDDGTSIAFNTGISPAHRTHLQAVGRDAEDDAASKRPWLLRRQPQPQQFLDQPSLDPPVVDLGSFLGPSLLRNPITRSSRQPHAMSTTDADVYPAATIVPPQESGDDPFAFLFGTPSGAQPPLEDVAAADRATRTAVSGCGADGIDIDAFLSLVL
jgi:hypothetical protein